jgi:L-aminopeptidase/D-esterase-like protein
MTDAVLIPLGIHNIQTGAEAVLPEGFLLGHAQDEAAGTGCTVVICEQGAVAGVAVRGAAPATRETDLLDPRNTVERINAVVLSGGSAFGLDAAGGAMRWLAERKAGLAVGEAVVPIVCGACIFDLSVGDGSVRPDASFGYAACKSARDTVGEVTRSTGDETVHRSISAADDTKPAETAVGNVGACTGASIGKLLGGGFAMKGGLGIASIRFGELTVTALVVVNALGNVFDRATGQTLAGTRDPRMKSSILDPFEALSLMLAADGTGDGGDAVAAREASGAVAAREASGVVAARGANTTIGCVLTNGALTKAQATRVADRAHDGYARAIEPVHTSFDGDVIFALSTATATSPDAQTEEAKEAAALASALPDLIGALGAAVTEAAILDAIRSAKTAYGLPSAHELTEKHNQAQGGAQRA